jgi:hypothetical protein
MIAERVRIIDVPPPAAPIEPDQKTREFYVAALKKLDEAKVPYVVGGGYAMAYYSGIARNTKDLDIFIKPSDCKRALKVLERAGYRTEYFYKFWIAKALCGESFIDILYNSGNGLCPVDDEWFSNSRQIEIHGYLTRLCPPEEQLFSKAFVMDRDRFDGTDVNHLIFAQGRTMDWRRLLRRFENHERVLMAHVMLYGYAYPTERDRVPEWVVDELEKRIKSASPPAERICYGTNVSQKGYGVPLREWGFVDGRLKPHGPLREDEVAQLPEP